MHVISFKYYANCVLCSSLQGFCGLLSRSFMLKTLSCCRLQISLNFMRSAKDWNLLEIFSFQSYERYFFVYSGFMFWLSNFSLINLNLFALFSLLTFVASTIFSYNHGRVYKRGAARGYSSKWGIG